MDDPQRLRAGCALAPGRFCIAVGDMQADDPFSIILRFDEGLDPPWRRSDVAANIVDLAASPHRDGSGYIAVGDEGDVFDLADPLAPPVVSTIARAGVSSEGADGSGPITGLATLAGRLHAFGASGQLYQQAEDGTWHPLPEAAAVAPRARIAALTQADDGATLMVGTIAPDFWEPGEALEREQMAAAMAGDLDRFETLARQAEEWAANAGRGGVATGFAALRRAGSDDWRRIDVGTPAELRDVMWDAPYFRVVGAAGTVLKIDTAGTVEHLTSGADRFHDLTGITRFDGKIVTGSDFALHQWGRSGLLPFDPALPVEASGPAQPIRVQAVADTLFVFDARYGVYRLSGTRWERLAIPPRLLERDATIP